MRVLVDTSVWVEVLRDASHLEALRREVGEAEIVFSRFTQLELLQGAKDQPEWLRLSTYLEDQAYLDLESADWMAAARIYFDLRRRGKTVRSPVDCCIAQLAIRHQVPLLHRDRDFAAIAASHPLDERRVDF